MSSMIRAQQHQSGSTASLLIMRTCSHLQDKELTATRKVISCTRDNQYKLATCRQAYHENPHRTSTPECAELCWQHIALQVPQNTCHMPTSINYNHLMPLDSNVLLACARFGYIPRSLLSDPAAASKVVKDTPQGLANSACSLGELGYRDDQLIRQILQQLEPLGMASFS